MGKDIKIIWSNDTNGGDFDYKNGDIILDNGFESAVYMSLFTDRRASDDDQLPDESSDDKRGWWGDTVANDIEDDKIGSKLWLLNRSKTVTEVLDLAQQYCEESLQWMIDDGAAMEINIETERIKQGIMEILGIGVNIKRQNGSNIALNYGLQWEYMQ